MDYKSPQAFRTISEVADTLDLPQHVLRFWETKFRQIKPTKRGGGRRYYRPEDIDLLRGIKKLLYDDGYTIKGLQKIFKDRGINFVTNSWRDDDELNRGFDSDTARALSQEREVNYNNPPPLNNTPTMEVSPAYSDNSPAYSDNKQANNVYSRQGYQDKKSNISFNRGNDYELNQNNNQRTNPNNNQRPNKRRDELSVNQINSKDINEGLTKDEVKSYPFKQDYFSRDEIFKLDEMNNNNNNKNNHPNNYQNTNEFFDETNAKADYVRQEHHIPTSDINYRDNLTPQRQPVKSESFSKNEGLSKNQIRILQASLFELGEIKRILES